MPVDASIYGLIRQPEQRNPLQDAAQVMSLQHAMGANALNTYQLAKAQREDADANAMSDLYRGAVNPDGTVDNAKILQGAAQRGLGARIPGIQKQIADADKARADVGKVKAETGKIDYEMESKRAEHAASMLSQAKDQATYDLVRQRLAQVNGPEYVRFMPAEFNPQFVQTEVARGMTVAQQLADRRAQEGHAITMRGQDLTDARTRSEGAANRSVTMRGQDLTDQRTREATSAAMSKPFEITGADGKPVLVQQDKQGNIRPVEGYAPKQGASKPLTDTQAKALQFGSRMQAAEDIFGQLEQQGVTTSIPGSRAGFGVGATINALQPASRQQLDQAKRDFINAVLRRESGAAISPTEFDSAEKQYFPQPGETDPKILAQKKANRQLAMRGILAEVPDSDNRVAQVRGAAAPAAVSGGVPADIAAILQKHGGK